MQLAFTRQPIVCLNMQDRREQTIVDTHTAVCKDLNRMVGGRVLFGGRARTELLALRAVLEMYILGETDSFPFRVEARHAWALSLKGE
jgi:hypothetical protein